MNTFKKKKLYLFGGVLRDRLYDNVHDKRIKLSDFDFLI